MIKNKCNLSPTITKKIIFCVMLDVSWERRMKRTMPSKEMKDPRFLKLLLLEFQTREKDRNRKSQHQFKSTRVSSI